MDAWVLGSPAYKTPTILLNNQARKDSGLINDKLIEM